MTKAEAIAYLRKKQLLEKQAIRDEIFNTREEAEEAMRELEETDKKNLTTDPSSV